MARIVLIASIAWIAASGSIGTARAAEPAAGSAGGEPAGPRRLPPELRGHTYSPAMSDREEPGSDDAAAAKLAELLPVLQKASERYERYALRFSCDETLRDANYSWSQNQANSETVRRYAYLLVFDADHSRYDVVRNPLDKFGSVGRSEENLDLPIPDAYAWTFLFSPRNQRTLHFRYLGREIKDFRLTHVIQFDSAVPLVEGQDTREWSGTVWIEENTNNFVRIEAQPSFQSRRLQGQWSAYSQSTTLPWGKSKPRPRGYELSLQFNFMRDDLLFPTNLEVRQFVWVGRGQDVTDHRFTLEYTNYHFFQTAAETVGEARGE